MICHLFIQAFLVFKRMQWGYFISVDIYEHSHYSPIKEMILPKAAIKLITLECTFIQCKSSLKFCVEIVMQPAFTMRKLGIYFPGCLQYAENRHWSTKFLNVLFGKLFQAMYSIGFSCLINLDALFKFLWYNMDIWTGSGKYPSFPPDSWFCSRLSARRRSLVFSWLPSRCSSWQLGSIAGDENHLSWLGHRGYWDPLGFDINRHPPFWKLKRRQSYQYTI